MTTKTSVLTAKTVQYVSVVVLFAMLSTILNPYLNLNCGVGIMAQQIKRKGSIILDSGVYWAVLKGNGKYQQISGIRSMVKSLSLCK